MNNKLSVVLVGSGHASSQVLLKIAEAIEKGRKNLKNEVVFILLTEYKYSIYSGMIPGCVSLQYHQREALIDNALLCQKSSSFQLILGRALSINMKSKIITYESTASESLELFGNDKFTSRFIDEPRKDSTISSSSSSSSSIISLSFDIIVINIGSKSKGESIPGVHNFTIPTRPIGKLLHRLEDFEQKINSIQSSNNKNCLVIGGGCAGIELIFALRERHLKLNSFKKSDSNWKYLLIERSPGGFRQTLGLNSFGDVIQHAMDKRGIHYIFGKAVKEVKKNQLLLDDGKLIDFDICLWATGAEPAPLLQYLGDCKLSSDGNLLVNNHLQSVQYPFVFAAGDAISIQIDENVGREYLIPKSGVYSVREGPILYENLMMYLGIMLATQQEQEQQQQNQSIITNASDDKTRKVHLLSYVPQNQFLKIINLSDGTAVSEYHGYVYEGWLSWFLKDQIDRRFVNQWI